MSLVYIDPDVQMVLDLHQSILADRYSFSTILEQLSAFAENLETAYGKGRSEAIVELKNYHPKCVGQTTETILNTDLKHPDFLLTIAKEYGYQNWEEAERLTQISLDLSFESAVDLLLAGRETELKQLLQREPDLIRRQSRYQHQAGLIHYIGSNGVEIWRQVVPANIQSIAQLLLDCGADPAQSNRIYGGTAHVGDLINTSRHPWKAGVGAKLIALFDADFSV